MTNLCLVGAGRIARIHAANIAAHPVLALHSVSDVDREAARALAEPFGARIETDAEAAIEDPAAQAVLIASSSHTHADLVIRAVAAKKPVFCEKPLDLELERAHACVRAVEAAGVPVFVDFNRRFDPNHAALYQAVRAGEAGSVEMISITSRDPEPPPLDYLKNAPGALFRETMVHDCDMARWLLGEEPVEVFATASCLIDPQIGALGEVDTAVAVLRTASGKLCQINNSWRATYGYDQRVEVLGSGGMVRSGNVRRTTLERYDARAMRSDVLQYFFTERYAASYRLALDHFADVARHGEEPFITAEDARRAQVIAEAALRSARDGRPVAISY
ncbi:MAG TPA: inositol 2-dehydrogenase [Geminicoccaceae bacterium]|nr:inositol 2-dehydrogenase [Geminicoccaceae bacterium]